MFPYMSPVSTQAGNRKFAVLPAVFMLLTLFFVSACDFHYRKRPYGYVRLGPLKNYLQKETFEERHNLFIRRDENGLSAMSTLCTYDLTALSLKRAGKALLFYSTATESTYDGEGHVLNGPARHDLPYFRLLIDEKVAGGPRDTLYAIIGDEVSAQWRVPLK